MHPPQLVTLSFFCGLPLLLSFFQTRLDQPLTERVELENSRHLQCANGLDKERETETFLIQPSLRQVTDLDDCKVALISVRYFSLFPELFAFSEIYLV